MRSYTGKELDAMIERRDACEREARLIAYLLVALSAGAVGVVAGWLARGWWA